MYALAQSEPPHQLSRLCWQLQTGYIYPGLALHFYVFAEHVHGRETQGGGGPFSGPHKDVKLYFYTCLPTCRGKCKVIMFDFQSSEI